MPACFCRERFRTGSRSTDAPASGHRSKKGLLGRNLPNYQAVSFDPAHADLLQLLHPIGHHDPAPGYAARVGAAAGCHSGLLRCSVNDENMMLKLTLILSSSLALASTECCR